MSKKSFLVVIPARMSSKRLPNKPMRKIAGISMIRRTYNQALLAVKDSSLIIVATDSEEIKEEIEAHGGRAVLTSSNCLTGTDRVREVSLSQSADIYINLQGDEPIFPVSSLIQFIDYARNCESKICTGIYRLENEDEFRSLNVPKMVVTKNYKLMYSSRAPIPSNKEGIFKGGYKHICIYSFTKDMLELYASPSKTKVEEIEDLEINRFLERGQEVQCVELIKAGIAVDTIEDLLRVEKLVVSES